MKVHKTVLAGSSLYFRTALEPKWTNTNLVVTVSPAEYQPFKEMLRFFYFGDIEQAESKSVGFLIQMLAVTDRFLATLAGDEIMKLLLDSAGRITRDDLVVFYNQTADVFDDIKLKTMFIGALSTELGNVDRLYLTNSCEQRRNFFNSLPLRAIVEFFSQDVLFVPAENMVLKLILYWIGKKQLKLQELSELRPVIRVGSLSFSVINEVVFEIPFLNLDFQCMQFLLNYSHNVSRFPNMHLIQMCIARNKMCRNHGLKSVNILWMMLFQFNFQAFKSL